MKAITICQPWAHVIALGLKRVENRTWPTPYRGPLAIHAGKTRAWLKRESPLLWPQLYGIELPPVAEMSFGAMVAVAELVDCVPVEGLPPELARHRFASGPWCWILERVQRLAEPIPCLGQLQLWTPPAQMTPRLLAASASAGPMYSKDALSR